MPEHSPGDIVRHPNFPNSRYTVVAGPDSNGCYALTNTGGEFLVRRDSFIVPVEDAPGDASDEMNMLLGRIVKLERQIGEVYTLSARIDTAEREIIRHGERSQDVDLSSVAARLNRMEARLDNHKDSIEKVTDRLDGVLADLAKVETHVGKLMAWKES